jgi:uncharacterized RDD family membrane protein YckC
VTDIPAPPPAPPNTTGGRIGAQVIDTLLFVPVFLAMARLFGEFGKQDDGSFQFNLSGWPFIFFLLVWLAYFTITEMVFGKSLGKRAVGLRVVAESGEPASTGQILIRNALRVIDILPFFYLVGFITTAVSSRHQRIGDLVAKTIVVAE